jgi:hypothetical protein
MPTVNAVSFIELSGAQATPGLRQLRWATGHAKKPQRERADLLIGNRAEILRQTFKTPERPQPGRQRIDALRRQYLACRRTRVSPTSGPTPVADFAEHLRHRRAPKRT